MARSHSFTASVEVLHFHQDQYLGMSLLMMRPVAALGALAARHLARSRKGPEEDGMKKKPQGSGSLDKEPLLSESHRLDVWVKADTPEGPKVVQPILTVVTDPDSRLIVDFSLSVDQPET